MSRANDSGPISVQFYDYDALDQLTEEDTEDIEDNEDAKEAEIAKGKGKESCREKTTEEESSSQKIPEEEYDGQKMPDEEDELDGDLVETLTTVTILTILVLVITNHVHPAASRQRRNLAFCWEIYLAFILVRYQFVTSSRY